MTRARRRPLVGVLAGLAVTLAVTTAVTAAPPPPPRPTSTTSTTGLAPRGAGPRASSTSWGVVDSACDPGRLAAQRAIGLDVAVVEARWDRLEPRPGAPDGDAVAELRARVARCLDAGYRVVLGPGVQYPPAWLRGRPGARPRDQRGATPRGGAVDVVFSAGVRDALAGYLRMLLAAVPAARLAAVRIGTSAAGEIGYPGPDEGGALDSWWAFGDAAQRGTGLAAGASPSPMPGWVPGGGTWAGRPVDAGAARGWFAWYRGALVEALAFQARTLRGAGFAGALHVPAPGRGVLPADLDRAVAARLDGTGDRDGSLGRGLDYVDQLPRLAAAVPGVVVDLTSVDDATAVAARALDPPRDRCAPGDPAASLDPATPVASWSNLRFARAQAARAGLTAVGENPGPPAPPTGGGPGSDSELEQVRRSPGLARACGLSAFLLAFEDDLHTGRSGVRLDDYGVAVAAQAAS